MINEYSDSVSETKRIGRGSIVLILGRFINLILSFAVVLIITRMLGTEKFGIYSFVMSIATMLLTLPTLIDVGMVRYATHYLVLNENGKAKDIFRKSYILLIVIIVASILLTIVASMQFSSFEYILTVLPYVFFSALSYLSLIIFFYMRNITVSVSEGLLKNILLLIFAPFLIGWIGLSGSLISYDIAAMITFLAMSAFLYILFWKNVSKDCAKENIKDILKFSVPNFLSNFLNNMAQRAGVFVLTYFAFIHGMNEVGYYNLALTVILSLGTLFFAIPEAMMPAILKFKTLEKKMMIQEAINTSLKYSLILTLPILFFISYFADPIVTLFFKRDYIRVGLNITILSFFLVLLLIKKHFITVIIAYNYVRYLLYAELASFFISMISAVILIPVYASRGAGVALVLGTAISLVVYIWAIHTFGLKFPFFPSLKIIASGTIFFILGFIEDNLLILILVSVLLWLGYIFLLYVMGELDRRDYDRLRSLI